jgi:hypothetical protein
MKGSQKCLKILWGGGVRHGDVLPHCYQTDHHYYHQRKCMLLHIREYTYVLHRRRSHEEFSYLDQRYVIILTQSLYTVAALLLLFLALRLSES